MRRLAAISIASTDQRRQAAHERGPDDTDEEKRQIPGKGVQFAIPPKGGFKAIFISFFISGIRVIRGRSAPFLVAAERSEARRVIREIRGSIAAPFWRDSSYLDLRRWFPISSHRTSSGSTIRTKRKSFTISFTGAVKDAPQVVRLPLIAVFVLCGLSTKPPPGEVSTDHAGIPALPNADFPVACSANPWPLVAIACHGHAAPCRFSIDASTADRIQRKVPSRRVSRMRAVIDGEDS